jgi:hypothetical protein
MEYYSLLQLTIEEVPTAVIWNMDEIGHSDGAEAHQELVYVPSDFEEDHIPIPVNRAEKRITLVGCICLDGTVRKSLVVIPRHTVGNDLSYWGCQIRIVTSAISRTGLSPRTFRDMGLGHFLQELKCKSHRILRASNFDHLRLHCPRCGLLL